MKLQQTASKMRGGQGVNPLCLTPSHFFTMPLFLCRLILLKDIPKSIKALFRIKRKRLPQEKRTDTKNGLISYSNSLIAIVFQENHIPFFLNAIFHGAENTATISLKQKQKRFIRLLVTVPRP